MQNLIALLSVLPPNFQSSCCYNRGKRFFILVIVEINCMTQIKEKTRICKAVVIATVVAIRDVIKNGFHYKHFPYKLHPFCGENEFI